jgi:hypothetical protein
MGWWWRFDAPAVPIFPLVDDQDPERKIVWSGLKPHAGWRLAAFCAEEAQGSSRTHEFTNGFRAPFI